jgi:hypothetical protein
MTSLRVSGAAVPAGKTVFEQAPANRAQVSGTITTVVVKIPLGETDVKKGVKVILADVTAGGRGMVGGGRGGDVGQMLDNLPPLSLAEMKKGDAITITTTQGADFGHATVVMLLAGVEPLLTSPAAARDIMAGWSLGGDGGEGR